MATAPELPPNPCGLQHHLQDWESTVNNSNSTPSSCGPAWRAGDLTDAKTYTIHLSASDTTELKESLDKFKNVFGNNYDSVTRITFPLPSLASRLSTIVEWIHSGLGFAVISGFDNHDLNAEDSTIIFLALSSHIGEIRGRQNKGGDVLTHITDSKSWTVPKEMRHGIHSNQSLPFHNDMGCDILGLQVRDCADTGGATYLAPVTTVVKGLVSRGQGAVVEELCASQWPVQVSGLESNFISAPVLQFHDHKLMSSVDPGRLGPHTASCSGQVGKVPFLTGRQEAALSCLAEAAGQNEFRVPLRRGDFLFFNNWALLHRRDSYQDADNVSRHLVRIWIRNEQLGWKVPKSMCVPWNAAYGPDALAKKPVYNIDPPAEYKAPKYTAGSAAFVIEDDTDKEE